MVSFWSEKVIDPQLAGDLLSRCYARGFQSHRELSHLNIFILGLKANIFLPLTMWSGITYERKWPFKISAATNFRAPSETDRFPSRGLCRAWWGMSGGTDCCDFVHFRIRSTSFINLIIGCYSHATYQCDAFSMMSSNNCTFIIYQTLHETTLRRWKKQLSQCSASVDDVPLSLLLARSWRALQHHI